MLLSKMWLQAGSTSTPKHPIRHSHFTSAETGKLMTELFEGHSHPVMSVAFSPDGSYVVSGSGAGGRALSKTHRLGTLCRILA